MKLRTLVILVAVATFALGPALASVAGPALLTDPANPRDGRYLREDDGWWVTWDKATYTVTPIGPAPIGNLFAETVPCDPTGVWCENEEGQCTWSRGPWAEPSQQSDFTGGRCLEIRAKGDGADAYVQFRPAARVAHLSSLTTGTQPTWTYSYRLVIRWHDTAGQMDPQGPGNSINPTTVDVTINGCAVDPDDQFAAVQGNHWFMDCVWAASDVLKIDKLIPATLERIDGRPVVGFDAQASLILSDGGSNSFDYVAGISCGDCFDEDPQ